MRGNSLQTLAITIATIACMAGHHQVVGQTVLSAPSWLVSFPGSKAQTNASASYFESTYESPAKPREVIDHYKKLFAVQDLPFQPNSDGIGASIRAETPECSLLLLIRGQGTGTWVQVSGAAKSVSAGQASPRRIETVPAPARMPAILSIEERKAEQDEHTRRVLAQADKKHRGHIRAMEKYDQPVYPRPKATPPPLAWPS